MSVALPIVRSDRHRLHEPGGDAWIGVPTPGTECHAARRRSATTIGALATDTPAGAREGMRRA